MNKTQISVVISLLNEQDSLKELMDWIHKVMTEHNFSYEVIFVDDGSTDNSWQIINELSQQYEQVKAIKFRRNYGKSAGLYKGFEKAEGDVVITMDADLQDSPDEIPELYRMITEEGYDLVSGWKKKRYDPVLTKNLPSKLYNATVRMMTGIKLHDFNCGLKAYRKQVVKSVEVYGEMHRYIPVLAKWAGFKKIGEKVVLHQERKYGVSKFGIERFIRGPLDLLSVMFMSRFSKRPMHFFGSMGTICFLIGFVILIYLSYMKLVELQYNMTQRPLFYLGIVCLILGVQLFLAGFLAEMISRSSSSRNEYLVDEIIK
ncbi:MAG: glycosyltransferase family 2 protein [Bacteroidales bacterium]|nr:glycosyltransferase family 2 protein [Bacteroidales bacterium]MCR4799155.1 glycosyltransferase family 2 protein [Bacteroidales bacterium]